jgi:uncharacterized protein YjbJ (UPF0337 family)
LRKERSVVVPTTYLRAKIDREHRPRAHVDQASLTQRIIAMDWNRVEGNWKEVKGKVKEKWGKLTDDDLTAINGQRDQLEGRLQQRYGFAKDQARKDVDTWFSSLK